MGALLDSRLPLALEPRSLWAVLPDRKLRFDSPPAHSLRMPG